VVVTVAIAFMMNVLSESILKQSVLSMTKDRIKEKRLVSEYTAHFSVPSALEEVLHRVAKGGQDDAYLQEARAWGGFSQTEMDQYKAEAAVATRYLEFFDRLKYVNRLRLIPNTTGAAIFDRLSEPRKFDVFVTTFKSIKSLRFSTSFSEFQAFLSRWPKIRQNSERIQAGHGLAIGRLRASIGDKTVLEALTDTLAFTGLARQSGFLLDEATAFSLGRQAKLVLARTFLEETIADLDMQKVLASNLDILPTEVTLKSLWKLLSQKKSAENYLQELAQRGELPEGLNESVVLQLSRTYQEEIKLTRAERQSADADSSMMGIGERMGWLVLISIIVCIVGIANVMLMSVTERFREIATLKCLGALDGFIMLSFMIEALLVGIVGGFGGSILGIVIGLGRMFMAFGSLLFEALPVQALIGWMFLSTFMGILLAVVASAYPSFKAARLAPMEAMRVE